MQGWILVCWIKHSCWKHWVFKKETVITQALKVLAMFWNLLCTALEGIAQDTPATRETTATFRCLNILQNSVIPYCDIWVPFRMQGILKAKHFWNTDCSYFSRNHKMTSHVGNKLIEQWWAKKRSSDKGTLMKSSRSGLFFSLNWVLSPTKNHPSNHLGWNGRCQYSTQIPRSWRKSPEDFLEICWLHVASWPSLWERCGGSRPAPVWREGWKCRGILKWPRAWAASYLFFLWWGTVAFSTITLTMYLRP